MPVTTKAPLLEVHELRVEYPRAGFRRGSFVAIDSMSVRVPAGTTLGVVGESGSGKSTLGRAILGLAPITHGGVIFDGREITHADARTRRALSADLQVVFQDPYSSLNPAMTIEAILAEPLVAAGTSRAAARARLTELLDIVGLPADSLARLPREFSGGQRQRIAIARAMAREPKLVVCDEAVSALDLSTQARVLDLLLDIQAQTGVAYLFITHDLDVVRHVSDEVVVVNRGAIVERGPAAQVVTNPTDPYTRRLVEASPIADPVAQRARRAARHPT
ncbi:ATP-binding cassette domain-containing protein [Nocardioides bruguierae]|uniref:ATP-binding cassette domain-containing protein n=1 Tax=Nocardioides bruguierae TaxID=2945102 RepID=A0A9X2D9R0_9ACTN|nr:ATP-binding cassette domain-containing protein [Nocardioides bruguierae]MCM0621392.1 ATP-binding cassette domain-containing protein [Nocardioides bruguierae]